ncbi:MAG: uL15 family ribosomal protein [archaeon]
MKTKSKIKKQSERKANKRIVETILVAKNYKQWMKVAEILSGPRKSRPNVNLNILDFVEGKIIIVCGKVLSQGEVHKKIKVVALGFSEKAKDKLLKAGCEVSDILTEIKSNPEAKEVQILK